MVGSAIEGVLPLLLLIAVGYFLCGAKWFAAHGPNIFSKYAVTIGIPCYMLVSIYENCENRERLLEIYGALPIPVATMLTSLLFALLLVRVFKIRPGRKGVFINAVMFCNSVIVGFPVIYAMLGEKALPDAMVYYIANTALFWIVGVYYLRKDQNEETRFLSAANLKQIFSPVLIAFFLGTLLVLFSVEIPKVLLSPLQSIGRTASPISILFIGCIIRQTDLKEMQLSRDLLLILLVRFLLSPVLMLLVCWKLPITVQMKQVFFIYSTMPAMTQVGIMAKECGSDYKFASVVVSVTTLMSLFFIPIYMAIMQSLGFFGQG